VRRRPGSAGICPSRAERGGPARGGSDSQAEFDCAWLKIDRMDDSGFEEDHVQLLAELTSQALLHQPSAPGADPVDVLEQLRSASLAVPPAAAAYLYGFTVCVAETVLYLTTQEQLPGDHPLVVGVCSHLMAEYARVVAQLCPQAKPVVGAGTEAASEGDAEPVTEGDTEPASAERGEVSGQRTYARGGEKMDQVKAVPPPMSEAVPPPISDDVC